MSKRFQLANPLWWAIIPGAFLVIFLIVYYPNVIPLSHLLSSYRTILIIALWATVIAHVFEALVARRMCQKLKIDSQSTLLWTIQTFILGLYIIYVLISIHFLFFLLQDILH
jgi:hypothetical protein